MDTNTQTLPTFEEAIPLGLGDENFVRDIYDVLDKHGNLERFGLCLLHNHFSVDDDEILLESNNQQARTLSLEVVKRSQISNNTKFTSWRIGGSHAYSLTACDQDKCKIEALTACDQDKCKIEALTACDQDKCKIEALTACDQDKCDKCK